MNHIGYYNTYANFDSHCGFNIFSHSNTVEYFLIIIKRSIIFLFI